MRVTDQYFWNFVFTVFFTIIVVLFAIILDTEARIPYQELTFIDLTLITLASWRLTRLFVYDAVTKFVREQFMDVKKVGRGYQLVKPKTGPRRTLSDLFSCPWCFGVWAATLVTFGYLWSEWFVFPTVLLAVAAVATFLQLLANLVGHRAEQLKAEHER
jgi:hypothetical protein